MKYLIALFSILCCAACGNKQTGSENGTPVSGAFKITCDETYFPLVNVLAEGYMAVYPNVVISIDTTNTTNIYSKLTDGTIRAAVTGISLNSTDSIALKQRNVFPKIFHFCTDAVVLISKAGADSTASFKLNYSEKKCLQEMITPVCERIITDEAGSENNLNLKLPGDVNDSCETNWYTVGNQKDILNRISEYPNEIGIIGWSHLCEAENPDVKKWRKRVTIIPLETDSSKLIYPTQSALMTGAYPLSRKLYLVTSEPYAGPATGFAAYVASDEGQRIIRLFGLAPYKTPPRELFVN